MHLFSPQLGYFFFPPHSAGHQFVKSLKNRCPSARWPTLPPNPLIVWENFRLPAAREFEFKISLLRASPNSKFTASPALGLL